MNSPKPTVRPSESMHKSTPPPSDRSTTQRLFEEFFVIGINEEDFSQVDLENGENPEAKILFSFPDSREKIIQKII